MIRHTVVYQIKKTIPAAVINRAYELLFELKNKLNGVIQITGGKCHFHEGKGAENFSHGFSIDFDNEEAYEDFLKNDASISFKTYLINLVEFGSDGIFSFDIGRSADAVHYSRRYKIQIPRLRLTPPGSIY